MYFSASFGEVKSVWLFKCFPFFKNPNSIISIFDLAKLFDILDIFLQPNLKSFTYPPSLKVQSNIFISTI